MPFWASMNILHVPYSFHPDVVGGTEIYVASLNRRLAQEGVECSVAAPGQTDAHYQHDGVEVWRFSPGPLHEDPGDLYALRDVDAAERFTRILESTRPDVVHLHALTRTIGLSLLSKVTEREIPVVFSYHTPTVTCQRGTLLRWGDEICDGKMRVHTCSACTLHGLGLKRSIAGAIGGLPSFIGKTARMVPLPSRVSTGLQMSGRMRLRHEAAQFFLSSVDHIIAMADWTVQLLEINGIPGDKITLSPHGRELDSSGAESTKHNRAEDDPVHLAWMGRLAPSKGLTPAVQALLSEKGSRIRLDVFPIVQTEEEAIELRELKEIVTSDDRISIQDAIPATEVTQTLCSYDALLVTSETFETGPLTVLEAFAAGIPVIGPDLGGVREKVTDGLDGILVNPTDPNRWTDLYQRITARPQAVRDMSADVHPPRDLGLVRDEVIEVYERVLSARATNESL